MLAFPKPGKKRKPSLTVTHDGREICRTLGGWDRRRKEVHDRAGGRCEKMIDGRRCNKLAPLHNRYDLDGDLMIPAGHAHHKNGTRGLGGGKRDDSIENLLWLDADCHRDAHSPRKVVPMKPKTSLLVLFMSLFIVPTLHATTWYVRTTADGGGSRYSADNPNGQCNGKALTPYPGSGVNQPCPFSDLRSMWATGIYTTGAAPQWGWVAQAGDVVDLGPNSAGWRIGATPGGYDGMSLAGDLYDSGAPPPPANLTVRGYNYASCPKYGSRVEVFGGQAVWTLFYADGSDGFRVECLDLTDHSECGAYNNFTPYGGSDLRCPSTADVAGMGFHFTSSTTNFQAVHVGLSGFNISGTQGPLGDGALFDDVFVAGNSCCGMNFDNGDGTHGSGHMTIRNSVFEFNGFTKEYPVVDALPYKYGVDQDHGGNGDAIGTSTVDSCPVPWIITVDNNLFRYNTQDGPDLLHVQGCGSYVIETRNVSYGNMGQQLKAGTQGQILNNYLVANCNAMRNPIPGTPAGYNKYLTLFCRAADTAAAIAVGDAGTTDVEFNTLVSASATGWEVDQNGTCNFCKMIYRNNLFLGFPNNTADGYPGGGNGNSSNLMYFTGANPFSNAGSIFDHNITNGQSAAWPCPNTGIGETNPICGDPLLNDDAWHIVGMGDASPSASSPARKAGFSVAAITTDINNENRGNPPTIGAYEGAVIPPPPPTPTPLVIATSSIPAGTQGAAYNATLMATGGTAPYTWQSTTLPAGISLSAAGVLSGTPTASGSSNVTVTVSDSSTPQQLTAATLALSISAPPPPTIAPYTVTIQPAAITIPASTISQTVNQVINVPAQTVKVKGQNVTIGGYSITVPVVETFNVPAQTVTPKPVSATCSVTNNAIGCK